MVSMDPLNFKILEVTRELVKHLRPVKVLDLYDGATANLHPDGLFSIETFGPLGSPTRDRQVSYIDIKVPIIHPMIYDNLLRLKGLYGEIINGTTYAIWDKKERDFEKSNELEGETGFAFFLRHWKDIKFKESPSLERKDRIDLVYRNKDIAMLDKVLVLPAGMRDLRVEDGKTKQDEINDYYVKLLSIANTIGKVSDDASMDAIRRNAQNAFNGIYHYVQSLLYGKHGFMQSKWARRNVVNGTRNVITAMGAQIDDLRTDKAPDFISTGIGMYQTMKGALPIFKYHLGNLTRGLLDTSGGNSLLVNAKTLKSDWVSVESTTLDKWTTGDGIEKLINGFFNRTTRHKEIMLQGHYLALLYRDSKSFRILNDIDQLPEGFDKQFVKPITYAELFYIALLPVIPAIRAWITRYPIGQGARSIYPSKLYLYSTVQGDRLVELDNHWQADENSVALEFPIRGLDFVDSLMPHASRLSALVGD